MHTSTAGSATAAAAWQIASGFVPCGIRPPRRPAIQAPAATQNSHANSAHPMKNSLP
jgi:hypothetical protein